MIRPTHVLVSVSASAIFLVAGCSSGEVATDEVPGAGVATSAPAPTEPSPPTTVAPPATTVAPTTVAPTTVAPTTVAPTTTTEPCGSSCPLSAEQAAVIDAFFEAYDGDDWDAFLAAIGTSEPTWDFSPTQAQNTELVRYDFAWASALNQSTTPETCFDQYGTIRCDVEIEDDLHRLLAPYGFPPSRCVMTFEIVDARAVPKSFNGFDCFTFYDGAMHVFGDWFDEQYPELDPIQGRHYRAWNQTDETAGERAAAHLEEWGEVVAAYVADGGDIFDLRPGGH